MQPYKLHLGDCREVMGGMPDCSVDSIVTDPPYGLSKQPKMDEVLRHWLAGDDYGHGGSGFMGKSWDSFVPGPSVWKEAIRCLKPGGWAVVFAGSRTQDLMSLSLRLAGFEIMDVGMWVYGSGFPKSLDISKAIDAQDAVEAQRARRLKFTEWVRATGATSGQINAATGTNMGGHYTTAAAQPAIMTREHLEMCRSLLGHIPEWVEREADLRSVESQNMKDREVVGTKTGKDTTQVRPGIPLQDSSLTREYDITAPATDAAKQWQGWGTALKPAYEPFIICRKPLDGTYANNVLTHGCGALNIDGCRVPSDEQHKQKCASVVGLESNRNGACYGEMTGAREDSYNELGRWPANVITSDLAEPWAKYFYCAKASKRDRDEGLDHLALTESAELVGREPDSNGMNSPRAGAGRTSGRRNTHPTVKPTDLMRYLCKLVTPPGGLVLDPFMGSGSTGKAGVHEGFRFIGIDMGPEYLAIAEARIAWEWAQQGGDLV